MAVRFVIVYSAILTALLVVAHTTGVVKQVCPLCRTKFDAELDLSGTQFGQRLDLKPLGPTAAPQRVAVCPKCAFVLFKTKFSRNELKKLQAAISTTGYRKLVEEQSPSYLMVAYLREALKASEWEIAYAYLCASWQVEHDPGAYRRCLEGCLAHLHRVLLEMRRDHKDWPSMRLLTGEVLRRLSRLDEAQALFRSLAVEKEFRQQPYRTICQFELTLIGARDTGPHPTPEIHLTAEDIRQTPGFKALTRCPKLACYTNYFDVVEPEDEEGWAVGVYLSDKPQWRGDFVPKQGLGCDAMAELIFAKTKPRGPIQVGLTPREVMAALQEVCQTPFVRELAKDPAFGGVRIRAAGDRLHWETGEVEQHRRTLQKNGLSAPPMREWISAILDLKRGKKSVFIGLHHPKGSDLYVVASQDLFQLAPWRDQYEQLTRVKPKESTRGEWDDPNEDYCPVVDSNGKLRLLNAEQGPQLRR